MVKSETSISSPTVHLMGPGKLRVLNSRLAFSTGKEPPTRLDPARLKHVLCYGNVGISDEAFTMLFHHNVQVSWLSPHGARFRGRLTRVVDQAVQLRMLQHHAALDPRQKLELARQMVADKVASQVDAARHYQRHGNAAAKQFLGRAPRYQQDIQRAADLDVLRGLEGSSSKAWFSLLGELFEKPWTFAGRVRRPPTDPVNALLSLGYTWLLNRMIARLDAEGLEVHVGMLHEYRPGRPSLGCDLIEPLRVPLVDRWVIEACARAWVKPDDFVGGGGGVQLQKDAFSRVLGLWENAWLQNHGARQLEKRTNQFTATLRQVNKQRAKSKNPT
jgi:CRISP-associated protein Cas1